MNDMVISQVNYFVYEKENRVFTTRGSAVFHGIHMVNHDYYMNKTRPVRNANHLMIVLASIPGVSVWRGEGVTAYTIKTFKHC